jgi:hypothetical protein
MVDVLLSRLSDVEEKKKRMEFEVAEGWSQSSKTSFVD